MATEIEIPFPDDWHVHLRDDAMLEAVVSYTALRFRYAMVMPNLVPPITDTAAATAYRARILEHAPAAAKYLYQSGETARGQRYHHSFARRLLSYKYNTMI